MTGTKTGEKDAMGAAAGGERGRAGDALVGENGAAIWIPTTRVEPARGVRPVASATRRSRVSSTRWFVDARLRRLASRRVPFGPPSSQPVADDIPDRPFLTDALLRAARDVAAGRDVVRAAVRDAREKRRAPSATPRTRNARRGRTRTSPRARTLAIARDASRSRSKSGASPSREIPAVGPPMDWAAAERELQERVQRERRERRERQRMTMAPRHVPARRRTGNTILAAATGRGGGEAEEESGGSRAQVERTWVRARGRSGEERGGGPAGGKPRGTERVGGWRGGGGWARTRDARGCAHTATSSSRPSRG